MLVGKNANDDIKQWYNKVLKTYNCQTKSKTPSVNSKSVILLSSFRFHQQFWIFSEHFDDDVTGNSAIRKEVKIFIFSIRHKLSTYFSLDFSQESRNCLGGGGGGVGRSLFNKTCQYYSVLKGLRSDLLNPKFGSRKSALL